MPHRVWATILLGLGVSNRRGGPSDCDMEDPNLGEFYDWCPKTVETDPPPCIVLRSSAGELVSSQLDRSGWQ
jgi:hypothetical protein